MIGSAHPEVAQAGAAHATSLWIWRGRFETEARHCLHGRAELRRGVAHAAARSADNDHLALHAIEILCPLLDDPDEKVRKEASDVLRTHDVLTRPGMLPYLRAYTRSRAFHDSQWLLIFVLKEYAGSLVPLADLLMDIVETYAGALLEASRDPGSRSSYDIAELAPLLIRLYEQAEGTAQAYIRVRCLDAWDVLLERRVGTAKALTNALDA
jgi:hypothetical protein